MRTVVSLLLMLLSGICCYGQYVTLGYDRDGNRVNRVLVTPMPSVKSPQSGPRKQPDNILSESLQSKCITVYPNPTRGELSVEISNLEESDVCAITVHSMNGQRIVSLKGGPSTLVDITTAPNALYLLTVTINGHMASFKIVKE